MLRGIPEGPTKEIEKMMIVYPEVPVGAGAVTGDRR